MSKRRPVWQRSALLLAALLGGCPGGPPPGSKPAPDAEPPPPACFPSFDPHHPPPAEAQSVFELSQDYPRSEPPAEAHAWDEIDFKKHPFAYMQAVLDYCLEGNVAADFRGQENTVRKWYHAPWLHDDGLACGNGREYLRGLTRERPLEKFALHARQDVTCENWAVGMYNPQGGYTLGRVWLSADGTPDQSRAYFREGTVAFKLLFTDAAVDKVPYLVGSLEWTANIFPGRPTEQLADGTRRCLLTKRENKKVLLLQVDIAVKDRRAVDTGWVFGTFVYDGSRRGDTVWKRLAPVGLSWGNDPTVKQRLNDEGSFINEALKETVLAADLVEDPDREYGGKAYMRAHGLGGRLNGPVDNPISSCHSCHARAATTGAGVALDLVPARVLRRSEYPGSSFDAYFAHVAPGVHERTVGGRTFTSLDYSLQLSTGIRNFFNARELAKGFNVAIPPEHSLPCRER